MKPCIRLIVLFFALALVLSAVHSGSYVSAQQKPACPVTKVTCPDMVYINDKLRMTADVQGGDSKITPTYNWTVSAGTIESGQGTSTIDVSTKDLFDGQSVTATVDIGGFDRACGYGQTAASCTTSVMKKPEARKHDQYGKLAPQEENERLDKFTNELQ